MKIIPTAGRVRRLASTVFAVALFNAALQQGVVTAQGTASTLSPQDANFMSFMTRQQVQIRNRRTGECVDDGNGEVGFNFYECDPTNLNQVFQYNPVNGEITNPNKPGMCWEDAGAQGPNTNRLDMRWCIPNNRDQVFFYSPVTQTISNPTKRLCFTSVAGIPDAPEIVMWDCQGADTYDIVFVGDGPQLSNAVQLTPDVVQEFLAFSHGAEVMLRSRTLGSCFDDGGDDPQYHFIPCDESNGNQHFRFDPVFGWLVNPTKKNMCTDDGGGTFAGSTPFHAVECDASNGNQIFLLDPLTRQLTLPTKGMCMDAPWGEWTITLWPCDFAMQVDLIFVGGPPTDPPTTEPPTNPPTWQPTYPPTWQPTPDPVPVTVGIPIFQMRAKNTDLCLDDGGASSNEGSFFRMAKCDAGSPNQWFTIDMSSQHLSSATKPGLCVDDGGASASLSTNVMLLPCDANSQNQVFSSATDALLNPIKNKCADFSSPFAHETFVRMAPCDTTSLTQHFEAVVLSASQTLPKDAALPKVEMPSSKPPAPKSTPKKTPAPKKTPPKAASLKK